MVAALNAADSDWSLPFWLLELACGLLSLPLSPPLPQAVITMVAAAGNPTPIAAFLFRGMVVLPPPRRSELTAGQDRPIRLMPGLENPPHARATRGVDARRQRVDFGSSASRSPSRNRLNASTVRNSAMPGHTRNIGSFWKNCPAVESIWPQDAVGGCTPTPRKDRPASPRM